MLMLNVKGLDVYSCKGVLQVSKLAECATETMSTDPGGGFVQVCKGTNYQYSTSEFSFLLIGNIDLRICVLGSCIGSFGVCVFMTICGRDVILG